MHTVKVVKDRPDFRCFIDLLYGSGRNVDTDGDCNVVHDRLWTWLYISDRESNDPRVEIVASESDPEDFSVISDSPELEELVALYLFLTSGESIRSSGRLLGISDVEHLQGKYAKQVQRADKSIWHQSSDERPYPNLG
jgi:hypothetical protein